MSSIKLDDLLKIGSEVLQTVAQTLSGAINELKAAIDAKPTVAVSLRGYHSYGSDPIYAAVLIINVDGYIHKIHGTAFIEKSVMLSASDPTLVTFNSISNIDVIIAHDSVIDVNVSKWGIVPENVSCTTDTCVVTLPADEDESIVVVRIYVK